MLSTNTVDFLAKADFPDLMDAIRANTPFFGSYCKAVMAWLAENRKTMYYQVLGALYDVAVYEVDGTGATASAPADEIGMFFASTLAGEFPDAPVIPLQKSMEIGYQVACELLGLEQLFKAEHHAGFSFGRLCHGASVSVTDLMPHIIEEVRGFEVLDVSELHMKVSEETGEFGEAVLIERGRLPGKKLNEPAMGEGADVIIATICVLAKHYPDLSPAELSTLLSKWVNVKMAKYSRKLHAPAAVPPVRQGPVGPVNKF